MTLHVLHAGDGYSYLTRQVATADRERMRGQELTDYYTAHGTPPGRWHGSSLEALSEISPVSGQVSEAQMKALFGEGRHPNTDAMLEAGVPLKGTALGRKFPEFRNEIPLVNDYNSTLRELAESGKTIDKTVTSDLWRALADTHYRAKFGHQAPTGRELLSWAAAQRSTVRQPVAGMDLVFTPQKSVSALWALAGTDTRQAIERIHLECVNDSLAWIEREATFTRRGDRSERQIDTHGLIVAQFDHYDTRAGDPNLHTHCAVSNKVLGADGRWSALDGAALHKHAVAASQRYNAALVDRLRREVGVAFTARYPSRNKQPVWEIAGIDQGLCRAFSSRRQMVETRRDELLAEYRDKHGRAPTQAVQYALLQRATLDTREGKQEPRSLAEHQSTWRQLAARHLGSEEAVDAMVASALNPNGPLPRPERDPVEREMQPVAAEAARVVEAVSDARATWTHAHVRAVVEAQLTNVVFDSPDARDEAVTTVVDHALGRDSLALSTPETLATPTALLRASDGLSVLERHGELLHTSEAMLAAERGVVEAAQTPVPVFTTGAGLREAITVLETTGGRTLNPGQRALAEHFCLSGQLVAAGVGPAGTGKTTSMKAVAAAWRASGRQVIALAPSAVAAETLGEEIGAQGHTLASLTYRWRGKMEHLGYAAGNPDGLPATIEPGAMLLLDEAAMASTKDVAALVEIAREKGAIVRMVGDPAQLDAIESGGLMRLVASETNAPELTDVVRFGDDTAQARASIGIRSGEADALQFHADKGWIHGGAATEMIAAVVADHFADTDARRDGIVLASTTATVRELNTQIQNRHRGTGTARTRRLVDLADDLTAGRGDIIVTRTNNSELRTTGGTRPGSRVANGDRWRVEKVGTDGSLTVRHLGHRGRVTLDAQYVAGSTELGYASTIHRAQGITVDVARTVVDDATNRRGLYVALSRGRYENHAYAITETALDIDTEKPHLAPEVDDHLTTARGVLAAALGRDEGHTTATEQLREALAAADDPERMADRYTAAREVLVRDYAEHLTATITDSDSETAATDTTGLRVAVDAALARGVDVQAALAHWREEVDSPTDPLTSLAGWLTGYTHEGTDTGPLAPLPSRHPRMDTELADYAAATLAEHSYLIAPTTQPDPAASGHEDDTPTPEHDSDPAVDRLRTSYLAGRTGTRASRRPRLAADQTTAPGKDQDPEAEILRSSSRAGGGAETALLAATHAELTGSRDEDTDRAREAALETVTRSREGRLTDEQLNTELEEAQADLADRQASHDRRVALSRPRDVYSRQVRQHHRELDARVEAIEAARPLAENLHRCQQTVRQAQQQWASAQRELGSLGRLAIRRRRELQDLLEITKVDQEMHTNEATLWSDALARITPDPGPEHTWDDTVSRAADTAGREKELTEAAQRDQPLFEPWNEQESAQAAFHLQRAQDTVDELVTETTRRSGLTAPQRELEQQVRTEEEERWTQKMIDATATALTSPGELSTAEILRRSYFAGREADRAAARDADTDLGGGGSSTSSRPDTGPDLGF